MRTAAQPHLRSRMSPIPSKTYFSVAAEFYECFRAAFCCSQAGAGRNAVRQDCAGRSLCPAEARCCSPMLTSRLRRLLPVRLARLHCHDVLCCSPTAVGMRQQSAAVGRRRTARLKEPQTSLVEKFSGRGLRGTQRCGCRCGPPRGKAAGRTTLRVAGVTPVL